MTRDPFDIYDPGDISQLNDYGTKAALAQFMKIWAKTNRPPWEWTLLAQGIVSGEVKPKMPTRTADRDIELSLQIQKHLYEGASQKTALYSVIKRNELKYPDLSFERLKKIWQRCEQKDLYELFNLSGDIRKDR